MPLLLQKWKDNRAVTALDSNANAAYAELIYQLREAFSTQLTLDINTLTANILQQYSLDEGVSESRLRIYCKMVNLVCRALREKREYNSLKEYSVNSYKNLQQKKALDKISPDFLIDLLDAICIASLRSKDYETCEHFTRLYEVQAKGMQAHADEFSYYDFIVYVGVTDLSLCTNQLEEAKRTMLTAKKKYARYTDSVRIYFLLRINLIAVHFSSGEYEECIKLCNEIRSVNEKEILKEPGFRLELILFSELYGIMSHYEEGDVDYAIYLLDKFKRKYASLLKQPDSRREKLFVGILDQLLNKPAFLKSPKFRAEAKQFIALQEFIAGDFEYISMNAWLNAKLTGRKYYSCFLELV